MKKYNFILIFFVLLTACSGSDNSNQDNNSTNPPLALTYSTTAATYTIDLPITKNIPTVTGTVTSWSISPDLPAGLKISTTTGVISGTPTEIQEAKEYIITASNSVSVNSAASSHPYSHEI